MAHADVDGVKISYLAGFLDGDASIFAQIIKRDDYSMGFQVRVCVSLHQKTARKHYLSEILEEIGYGRLRDRNDGMSEINLVGPNSVGPFLRSVFPFLRLKKKQASLLLKIIDELPKSKKSRTDFLQICTLADQIAALNDGKNRTVTRATVEDYFISHPPLGVNDPIGK